MKNATYLFELPNRKFKNSESRWTAIAHLSLIYMSSHLPDSRLPVYHSDKQGYLSECNIIQVKNFTHNNIVCEPDLNGDIFGMKTFPDKYIHIKPDILSVDSKCGEVIIIEVKTLNESVQRTISLYHDFRKWLTETSNFKNCRLFYLISHGHERLHAWPVLSDHNTEIILWEDLFKIMSNTPISNVLADNLEQYCVPPAVK